MKCLSILCLLVISAAQVRSDLLDHLDHDDIHDHHDHDDHLEDRAENLAKELLFEIERFLPSNDPPVFESISVEEPFDFGISLEDQFDDHNSFSVSSGIGVQNEGVPLSFLSNSGNTGRRGVPLTPPANIDNTGFNDQFRGVPLPPATSDLTIPETGNEQFGVHLPRIAGSGVANQVSDIQTVPQVPEFEDNTVSLSDTSFGLPPVNPAPNNQRGRQPTVIVDLDSGDDFTLKSDIPDSFSFAHDSHDTDFDDVSDNIIGGQGRQLDDSEERPIAPDSFFPFDGDFPRYDFVPATSFSCADHQSGGYYADPEGECQVFHICHNGDMMGSFLCPYGTLFNQALFVCDWWYNVDCSLAQESYQLNARIGVVPGSDEDFS